MQAGATIVNDVSGGSEDRGMLPLVAQLGVGYIAMHRVLPPDKDSYSDAYTVAPIELDVTSVVLGWMRRTLETCEDAGIAPDRIVLDPGLGFGKTVEQNIELIRNTPTLCKIGRPVLSGASRKSFVGRVTLGRDSEPHERGAGTVAFTALHRSAGASVFRVHDVAPAVEAIKAADALRWNDTISWNSQLLRRANRRIR
ncbi:MAG: dihydropteroate synthase [Planctomycetota bacterium]